MYEPLEKTPEQKSQSVANTVSQKQNNHAPTSHFVDNRPQVIQMRKLRELAKNSPRNTKLRELHHLAAAHSVAQKKRNGKQGFGFVDNRPEVVAQRKLKEMANKYSSQQQQTIQKKENNTGLPDNLKSGMENLSGMSLDDVKVHRNSDKPAQLQAHAYAQGTDIHLGPRQEKHLPHEAWHVVQQKQGRVKPTMKMKGDVNLNDDVGLEKEAGVMGAKVLSVGAEQTPESLSATTLQLKGGAGIQNSLGASGSKPIQRYLIVGGTDYTRWYKEQYGTYNRPPDQATRAAAKLDAKVTEIAKAMIQALNPSDAAENQMIKEIQDDEGGVLRRQLSKWIEDTPGLDGNGTHPTFGRKSQTRAYANFKDLTRALFGWVKAKQGRRDEKTLANRVQTGDAKDAISYHLDSILIKIREWVNGHASKVEIRQEIGAPATPINENTWNIYQNYFNNVGTYGAGTQLPRSFRKVIRAPQKYDVRQKTGMLHDLMHYFMAKYPTNNAIDLVDDLGEMNATVLDGGNPSQIPRQTYDRPKNTQIRPDQTDERGLVNPNAMPGAPGPARKIQVSQEEEHHSYKFARSKGLPMYGRHSFTAARMMRMVQQSGGSVTEISAMAWSIMSYWRLNYDHTSIPYHTLHEIMDFLPEFGGAYDPDHPHAGIDLFTQAGLIQSLHQSILHAPKARDIDKLIATDTAVNNAEWFLANKTLWVNADVMNFLSTTVLVDSDFFALDKAHLQQFFDYDAKTQHLKTRIPKDRRNYVDGEEVMV